MLTWDLHFSQYLPSQYFQVSFHAPDLNMQFLTCSFLLLDIRKPTVMFLHTHPDPSFYQDKRNLNTFSQRPQSWLQVVKSKEIFTAMQGWCWQIPVEETRIRTLLNNGTLCPVQSRKFTSSKSIQNFSIAFSSNCFKNSRHFLELSEKVLKRKSLNKFQLLKENLKRSLN